MCGGVSGFADTHISIVVADISGFTWNVPLLPIDLGIYSPTPKHIHTIHILLVFLSILNNSRKHARLNQWNALRCAAIKN